ncbi:hypothetical protein [Methylocapsa aurea]|jgi:hypothetical protein|uniref:hypothetical protein n=1 Tax=Methylocapsa aurea TaxID=663610 RepID=UPI003D18AAA5
MRWLPFIEQAFFDKAFFDMAFSDQAPPCAAGWRRRRDCRHTMIVRAGASRRAAGARIAP